MYNPSRASAVDSQYTQVPVSPGADPATDAAPRNLGDELRACQDELRFCQEALHRQVQVFNNIYDGVILTDLNGAVLDWNPGAQRMFGYAREEILGKDIGVLSLPEEAAVISARIEESLLHEGRWAGERRFVRKDGTQGVAETVMVPLRNADGGEPFATLSVNRDITERQQAAESQNLLRTLNERVKELTALHHVTHIIHEEGADTRHILTMIAAFLTSAFQYSDVAEARIRLEDLEVATPGFITASGPPEHLLRTQFATAEGGAGSIEIAYREERPAVAEGPFLTEERALIDSVAEILRVAYDRRKAEEALQKSREQLRALTGRLEQAVEEERKAIARELHDELGQALTSLRLDLSWLGRRLPALADAETAPEVEARITAMSELVRETIHTTRRISRELRPPLLDDLGLEAALEWLASDFTRRTEIACRFTVAKSASGISTSAGCTTAAYRIAQEALTNVARHSGATSVNIRVKRSGALLVMEVRDNGRGITEDEIRDVYSLGLLGMRERAHLVGGEVEVRSIKAKGTAVIAHLPLDCGHN